MRFALILVGVTLVTLVLIFGVYKLFLQKPVPTLQVENNPQATANELQPTSLPSTPSQTPSSTTATPSPTVITTPKASSSSTKPLGTLTVLQNTTSTQSSTSPISNSTISGTINLTGNAPSGTSLVIVARLNGSGAQFKTVVSGIPTTNNATWSWTSAQNGKTYDMIAVLKGSSGGVDTDYALSQNYIVTAPAVSQAFSVNASSAPAAPTGTATISCTTHNTNNTWAATVNYPSVSGAQMYILQLGSASGASDIANSTTTTQSLNVTLNDSVTYYSQYAIANAPNPTSAQYSPFSTPSTIKCP